MNAIEVDHLVKKFGDLVAVNDISFNVASGEIFGLLGPNGAGKTTLIRMMTTLTPPTSGTARIGGHDIVKDADGVRHVLGVIPQAFTSDPELTARENMLIHAKLYGVPADKRDRADRRACSNRWTCSNFATRWCAHFPAACAAAWKSRAAWSIRRKFCFSTSRPPASIPSRARTCGK